MKTDELQKFIAAIKTVYLAFGLSIAHEDTQGAFVIEAYRDDDFVRLKEARVDESARELLDREV